VPNATCEIAICRQALTQLISACRELNIEKDNLPRWEALQAKLPDYVINSDGALAPSLFQRALAHQIGGSLASGDDRQQRVTGKAAPCRQVFLHRGFGGEELEQATARQRIDVLSNEEQQAAAAVEVPAIETCVGRMRMVG